MLATKGGAMPGRPPLDYIAKGAVHKKIDPLVNDTTDPKKREALLMALKDSARDYVQILVEHAGVTEAEAAFLRRTWYNPNGWWRDHQPIEPIVRQGLIKSIELAIERNLPIDSYWVSGGDQLQVIVTCSNYQVTRLILTPSIAAETTPAAPSSVEPIWIVRQGAAGKGEITVRQVGEAVTG
jgi:hypothetical protein